MIGRLLRPVRAGERHLAERHRAVAAAPASLTVSSPTFGHGQSLPQAHAGHPVGDDVAPGLEWTGVPEGCEELALVVEDPSAPLPRPVVHALVVGIPGSWTGLTEAAWGQPPAAFGRNTLRRAAWSGPRPVPGHGAHTYAFQLFAADQPLGLRAGATRSEVLTALDGHTLARGRLDGSYER